jgi:hypothetical protein
MRIHGFSCLVVLGVVVLVLAPLWAGKGRPVIALDDPSVEWDSSTEVVFDGQDCDIEWVMHDEEELDVAFEEAPGAAYQIVAHDPNLIRRMAREGVICGVLGHQWQEDLFIVDGETSRTCSLCGLTQKKRLVPEHWTEWK